MENHRVSTESDAGGGQGPGHGSGNAGQEESEYGKDSWLEDILSDVIDGVVEKVMENNDRKRKRRESNVTSDNGVKQPRLELFEYIPICLSPKYEIPEDEEDDDGTLFCLRCLKRHIGGEKSCRSNEEGCFICGEVGHFKVVHEVEDKELRNKISIFLEISHHDMWEKYVPEIVTLEDKENENETSREEENSPEEGREQEFEEETSNQSLYRNPFHESDSSSGEEEEKDDLVEPSMEVDIVEPLMEDDIVEPLMGDDNVEPMIEDDIVEPLIEDGAGDNVAPVIELDDDDDDDEITTCDITNDVGAPKSKTPTEHQKLQERREMLISNQQNINAMIANAIQHQVSGAQAQVDAAAAALPAKLVEGPNAFLCKICNVTCNTPEMLKIHEGGQKHRKKVLRNQHEGQTESKTTNPKFGCDICGIECPDGVALITHFKGKRHGVLKQCIYINLSRRL